MPSLKLEKLRDTLRALKGLDRVNYTIPDVWNCFDYEGPLNINTPDHQIMVNPADFYASLIETVFLPRKNNAVDPGLSLSKARGETPKKGTLAGDWVKASVVYSTMIRASAAWDHDRSGILEDTNLNGLKETGTFVKMLAMLPLLEKMGVNTVYMLPISKFSLKDKKGDLGSPYGVSNFEELDPNLKDPLTGDAMTLDEEFQAFIEACHLLDMRVMIDIIPRTNAVENDLIKDHPDWFYWIKASEADQYAVPRVETVGTLGDPTLENMKKVYAAADVKRHLAMFQVDPRTQNPVLWQKVKRHKRIAEAIETHYDLRIAPAFSDYINDPQPPWTDITFFRMYLDHPQATRSFLEDPDNTPPYILNDTIKSNLYPGEKPNRALWETLADIVPSYQKRFGIDGARIDMGHALPPELIQMIFNKARAIDPDFAFIAEELQPQNAASARKTGYNMIIGNGFILIPRVFEGKAHEFYYEARHLDASVFTCGETHDTPRMAAREGGETLSRTTTLLNMFVPNGVPFINSAQEVFEKQPMNLGLDSSEADLHRLDNDDPYYGKLALFDRYQFHYTHPRRWDIPHMLEAIKPIRKRYMKELLNSERFVPIYDDNRLFVGFAFYKKTKQTTGNVLMILANLNPYHECRMHPWIRPVREASKNTETVEGRLLYSTHEPPRVFTQFLGADRIDLHLGAGEVKIVEF
ncbi:MAG: alpha-amylase [Acholeplasmatales bacterium]|nr:MAG: alpha-amylase [Acholeplasmatales bacterium]